MCVCVCVCVCACVLAGRQVWLVRSCWPGAASRPTTRGETGTYVCVCVCVFVCPYVYHVGLATLVSRLYLYPGCIEPHVMCVCVCVCVCACVSLCTCMHWVLVCVCVCVCVCTCAQNWSYVSRANQIARDAHQPQSEVRVPSHCAHDVIHVHMLRNRTRT